MTEQTQASPASEAPIANEGSRVSAAIAMLGSDVEIDFSRPLPEYDTLGAVAFEARDKRVPGRHFALLCGRAYVPRITVAPTYRNIKNPKLMRLLDGGIVTRPGDQQQYYAYIFERPVGRKFIAHPDETPLRVSEDHLVDLIISPILSLLLEFRNADMVHGAISLSNLYIGGPAGAETLTVGECLSSAPSARQHPIYETIERGAAQPMGRGPGLLKDDLYALGVCVAMIARGVNLMTGRSKQEIILDKITHGSYAVISGRERMPGNVSEFLRGVLNDDEKMRWDIDGAMKWLSGVRENPKQSRPPYKAARPFVFMEKKFWELRSLALAFGDHVPEAIQEIEKDQFDLWLKRNFEDPLLEARLAKVLTEEKGSTREKLVCSLCMAFDPHGPVRYKKLSILPAGYGGALAEAMAREEDVTNHIELVTQQVFNTWITQRFEEINDGSNLLTTFEKCRNFLTQKMAGNGVERVLYVMNKEAACMSPLFKQHIVLNVGQLALALEALAARGEKGERVLDRHMIAFISVREPKMIDPHLGHVVSHERGNQLVGITRTLAAIQKAAAFGPLPALGNWLIDMMGPAVDRVLDRDLRKELTKRVEKQRDKGDLSALLDLIDDAQLMQADSQRYMQARLEYAGLEIEKKRILMMKSKPKFGYGTGRQVAMVISASLGTIIILAYLAINFAGRI